VYVGRYTICEAQGRKVRVSNLYDYVGSYRILVRRDLSLSSSDGLELAINALQQVGDPYGYFTLLQLGWQSLRGFWRPFQILGQQRAFICSQLYAGAYAQTTGRLLVTGNANILCPADLAETNRLTDIKVDWLTIS